MNRETKGKALARLEEMYPEAKAELVFSNPYEMMVATILSAQWTRTLWRRPGRKNCIPW